MDPSDDLKQAERRSSVIWNIRIDAATGEVVAALQGRGVKSVVLKGAALRDLYPEDSTRRYMDGDIWISPANVRAAESVLEAAGFRPRVDERGLPEWWLGHATSWRRAEDGGSIDLHRKLQGLGVSPAVAWERLTRDTRDFTIGGVPALRLSDPGTALYLAIHAAHHGRAHPSAIAHVETALEAFDLDTWVRAAELATELQGLEGLSVGLRLVPEGRALAERLGVPESASVDAELHGSSSPPVAMGLEQLSRATWLRRLRIVVRKVFPPPGFIRYWWAPAANGPLMLVIAYLYRPLWLVMRTPAGWRAWRAARRRVEDRRQV